MSERWEGRWLLSQCKENNIHKLWFCNWKQGHSTSRNLNSLFFAPCELPCHAPIFFSSSFHSSHGPFIIWLSLWTSIPIYKFLQHNFYCTKLTIQNLKFDFEERSNPRRSWKWGKQKGSTIKTVTLTHEYVCSTPTCGYDLGLNKTLRFRWFSRDWD